MFYRYSKKLFSVTNASRVFQYIGFPLFSQFPVELLTNFVFVKAILFQRDGY